jgi:hypothetical protein
MDSTRTSISELPSYESACTSTSDTTTAPPPYTYRASQAEARSVGAAAGDTTTADTTTGNQPQPQRQQRQAASASASASTSRTNQEPESSSSSSSSSSTRPLKYTQQGLLASAKDAYRSHKAAKDASRKVQFYEQIYGFVPKNVMTEAEWKAARKKAPVVKKEFRARGYWVG